MKQGAFITILFLLFESVIFADTLEEHKDCPAPISVIGNHVHTSGELMLSYRRGPRKQTKHPLKHRKVKMQTPVDVDVVVNNLSL